MKILCTMPGKYGDSLWAMPTVRAIAEANGGTVDLLMSPKYDRILPLYRAQDYIRLAEAWPTWRVQDTAPMTPWSPFEETLHHEAIDIDPERYDQVVHLGYREWPDRPLPHCIYEQTRWEYPDLPIAAVNLYEPWIRPSYTLPSHPLVVGFTDEWFELKYGIYMLLFRQSNAPALVNLSTSPRWREEGNAAGFDNPWIVAAGWIDQCVVFLGCCSALHVLACAMGKPVVLMEPNEQRWNDVFYPYGKTGRVKLVTGNDGKPTFDARHVIDAVRAALSVQ